MTPEKEYRQDRAAPKLFYHEGVQFLKNDQMLLDKLCSASTLSGEGILPDWYAHAQFCTINKGVYLKKSYRNDRAAAHNFLLHSDG